MLAVSRDLLHLFIELDKTDGSLLKTTITAIRNQLETARDQEVDVIDVDAPITNIVDNSATPKSPSLGTATDEVVAALLLQVTHQPSQEYLLRR